MYFASDQLLAKHAPPPDDIEGWNKFYSTPEYAEIARLQKAESSDLVSQHRAYAERHGSSWSPERRDQHDKRIRYAERGITTPSETLQAMMQIHGSEHPLSRPPHLGPQFGD